VGDLKVKNMARQLSPLLAAADMYDTKVLEDFKNWLKSTSRKAGFKNTERAAICCSAAQFIDAFGDDGSGRQFTSKAQIEDYLSENARHTACLLGCADYDHDNKKYND